MAISRIGSATGTTSATLPAHQAGDLIVGFAFRDGSNTAPTVPGSQNWNNASSGGANTCSGVLVWKVAASSGETTGTFTNATSVVFVVYRGTHLTAPIGTISTMSGATSTVAWPSLALTKTDSGSWIVGMVGSRSIDTTIDTAPSGLTKITSVLDATDEAAAHDTNGGVASWSSTNQSIGGTASGWFGRLFEILPAPNLASGPGLQAIEDGIAQIEQGLQRLKDGVAGIVASGGGGGLTVDAVAFNADRLERGGALTGVSDSGDCIVSYWIKTTDASGFIVFIGAAGPVSINLYYDQFYNNGADGIYTNFASSIADGNWHHVLCALRMSTNTIQLYVDGSNVATGTTIDGSPSTAFFSDTDWAMCDTVGGGNPLTADLAEFYFAPGKYLDISVQANREKFRTAGGKPEDLGSDGSTPTGSQPAVYLSVRPSDAATVWATNKGSGGNFTITGSLAIAATSPSD